MKVPLQSQTRQLKWLFYKKLDARPLRDANTSIILSMSLFITRFARTLSMRTTARLFNRDCPSCFGGSFSSALERWKTSLMCQMWLIWCSKPSPPLRSVEGNRLVRCRANTQEHQPRTITWRHHYRRGSFWTYLVPQLEGPCPVYNDPPPVVSFAVQAGSPRLHRRAHKVHSDRFRWSASPVLQQVHTAKVCVDPMVISSSSWHWLFFCNLTSQAQKTAWDLTWSGCGCLAETESGPIFNLFFNPLAHWLGPGPSLLKAFVCPASS